MKLSKLPKSLVIPKRIGYNYDNCGENKVINLQFKYTVDGVLTHLLLY